MAQARAGNHRITDMRRPCIAAIFVNRQRLSARLEFRQNGFLRIFFRLGEIDLDDLSDGEEGWERSDPVRPKTRNQFKESEEAKGRSDERRRILSGVKDIWRRKRDEWLSYRRSER